MNTLPPATPPSDGSSSGKPPPDSKTLGPFPWRAFVLTMMLIALPIALGTAAVVRMRNNHWSVANLQIRGAKLHFAHQWNPAANAFDENVPPPGWALVKTLCGEYGDVEVWEAVWERQSKLDDPDLLLLARCPRLQSLALEECEHVSDSGLAVLSSLPRLTVLRLSGRGFTDAATPHVAQAYRLERLALRDTRITDAGVRNLLLLKALRKVDLHGSPVSEDVVGELRQARADLEVVR